MADPRRRVALERLFAGDVVALRVPAHGHDARWHQSHAAQQRACGFGVSGLGFRIDIGLEVQGSNLPMQRRYLLAGLESPLINQLGLSVLGKLGIWRLHFELLVCDGLVFSARVWGCPAESQAFRSRSKVFRWPT